MQHRVLAGSRPLRASLLALACASATAPTPAQSGERLQERWVARYDGPAADVDQAEAFAVTPHGDVYVAGPSARPNGSAANFGIGVVRYDTGGRVRWVARYDQTFFDTAAGIVVDAAGNVYVAGSSTPNPPWPDIFLLKLDRDGRYLWHWTYDEFANNDEGIAVALDPAGNVIVTGHANGLTGADYFTTKLDPNGNVLWQARYHGGPQSVVDLPVALAVDAQGRVYVTGTSRGTGNLFRDDIVTVGYDSNGVEQWVRRYDGPGAGIDEPEAIAVDPQGNVIVTGSSLGSRADYDAVTIKYAPDGTEQWVRRYHGSGDGSDGARGLIVDAVGDIYVAGNSQRQQSGFDMLTLKYDGAGQLRWASFYDSGELRGDHGRRLALDGKGHVFVTGQSVRAASGIDYVTVAYDVQRGREIAVARYDGPSSNIDFAEFIGTDALGNVFVAGSSDPGVQQVSDFTVVKYALGPECVGDVGRFGVPGVDGAGLAASHDWAGCPDRGGVLQVSMVTGTPGPCLLALGFSDAMFGGVALPFPFAGLGAPGSHLWVSPDVLLPFPPNAGNGVSLQLPVPNLTGGLPVHVYLQGFHLDPAANVLGLVAADALDVTLR